MASYNICKQTRKRRGTGPPHLPPGSLQANPTPTPSLNRDTGPFYPGNLSRKPDRGGGSPRGLFLATVAAHQDSTLTHAGPGPDPGLSRPLF